MDEARTNDDALDAPPDMDAPIAGSSVCPMGRQDGRPRPTGTAVAAARGRARAAREQLLAVEALLRDLWVDVIEDSPVIAARANAAARLAHRAAVALEPEMVM